MAVFCQPFHVPHYPRSLITGELRVWEQATVQIDSWRMSVGKGGARKDTQLCGNYISPCLPSLIVGEEIPMLVGDLDHRVGQTVVCRRVLGLHKLHHRMWFWGGISSDANTGGEGGSG